jgi:D-glycero-alpha-D-manno-heptose 1-phosphate guanylyltransferase
MNKEAIILAGGFGTRLKSVVSEVPKPMALINGIPFLSFLLEQLHKNDFAKVIIAAGYKSEIIEAYYGTSFKETRLLYSIEKEPLGTGGAIFEATSMIESDYFFVLNGDTFFNIDFSNMEETFLKGKSGLSVALKAMINSDRYGTVNITGERITSFNEKAFCEKGLINGGIYLINKNWFKQRVVGKVFSFEKDILEKEVKKEKITYYISDSYFIDIGVPKDYFKAVEELPAIVYPPTPLQGG